MVNPTDIKLNTLTMISLRPLIRRFKQWWFKGAEEHYLICAAVEHERVREAEENEAYYQKRAAIARAEVNWH